MIDIDRLDFIAGLGGAAAVGLMSHEARADELEEELNRRLQLAQAPAQSAGSSQFPTAAEVDARITTRSYRRGAGRGFLGTDGGNVERLPAMPAAPTFLDFFELRFGSSNHCLLLLKRNRIIASRTCACGCVESALITVPSRMTALEKKADVNLPGDVSN